MVLSEKYTAQRAATVARACTAISSSTLSNGFGRREGLNLVVLDGTLKWGLTFDMSGGPKGAKRPLERPLDGGVRRRLQAGERTTG